MHPEPQSEREDLVYHEHKPFFPPAPEKRGQRETSQEELPGTVVRRPNNPLDIAVMRLAELERNIERRYLKRPLRTTFQIRPDNVTIHAAPPSSSGDGEGVSAAKREQHDVLHLFFKSVSLLTYFFDVGC